MKALLIGTGMVAPTHVAALRDAGVTLDTVMGRDPGRTAAFADTHGGTPVTHIDDALARVPDLAIVTTPPDARADIAAALAAAHVPTIMEKPIERRLAAARAIVDTYAATDTPLGIFFQHRTRAAARHLARLLADGSLGQIVHVEICVPWWRDQAYYDAPGRGTYARDGGGVLITQAIHTLDTALWLVGPATGVQAQTRTTPLHRLEAEDLATALLTFANGATGHLFATTAAYPGGAETIRLITSRAHVLLEGDTLTIDPVDGTRQVIGAPGAGTGGGADPMAFTHAWHQTVVEDFVAHLATGGPTPISGQDALAVHALIDAIERAARARQFTEVSP